MAFAVSNALSTPSSVVLRGAGISHDFSKRGSHFGGEAFVRISVRPVKLSLVTCSAEGPLRRPAPLTEEKRIPSPPAPPVVESVGSIIESPSSVTSPKSSSAQVGVTIEYQRQRAKEMTAYFQDRKFEEQVKEGRVFGWTRKNEISNGRWTMFGLSVGLLTEYATGVDFPEQLKIIVNNLGIADI